MNVAASVAIAVAERVQKTGGARAGLVAWKTLAGNTADGVVRGKALLAAMQCATTLRDEDALADLAARWLWVDSGIWDDQISVLCIDLVTGRLLGHAIALARAESERNRTARSLYCHARCLDLARDPTAASVFDDAIERSVREGAKDIELAARVRRAVILARSWDTMSQAFEEAQRVDTKAVPHALRLDLADVLLRSPSRFTRAGAIGLLDQVATASDDALARRALAVVARWVDAAADAITPLEVDRIAALLKRDRATKLAPKAYDVFGSIQAILVGRTQAAPSSAAPPAGGPWDQLLHVDAALREGEPLRSLESLRSLAQAEERAEVVPSAALGLAARALTLDDADVVEAAVRVVAGHLLRGAPGAPPEGWLAVADVLAGMGKHELALTARRAAAAAREPGATESLGARLAREGWELARAGERDRAIAMLEEAKALLQGTSTL